MGPRGAALELGMALAGDEPRMAGQLHHLHEPPVRRRARHRKPRFDQALAEGVVHLITMTVTLIYNRFAVSLERLRARLHLARISSQAHGSALALHILLLGHEVHHGKGRLGIELGRRGPGHAGRVAREHAYGSLQPQADAQVGNALLARVASRGDLALEGALAETARHEDAVHAAQHRPRVRVRQLLAVHEVHVHAASAAHPRMPERLDHRQIRVGHNRSSTISSKRCSCKPSGTS